MGKPNATATKIFTVEGTTGRPQSWHVEMHGNAVTPLQVNGRALIGNRLDGSEYNRIACALATMTEAVATLLKQKGIW